MAKRTAPHSRVLAVVKANAYGHGIDRMARALPQADGFATLEIESAVRLRERLQTPPILLLEGFFDTGELIAVASFGLATVVHDAEQLRMIELTRPARMLDVWVKVNTGMNRLGFATADVPQAVERLRASGAVKALTLMTHFASSDAPPGVSDQLARFNEATSGMRYPRSLANTAAIFAHPESHGDVVRLGIGLYGATPFAERSARSLGLKPAMSLTSRLIAVQELRPGDTIGYGNTFKADRGMRVGVVACGYADGYPRHAPNGTPVLVDGVRTRTVGRVSMDMLTVDLGPVASAAVGTEVELFGERLAVDEVATAAGTVGYEMLCAVAPRVPFIEVE
jgi:alanine racemase